MASEFSRVRKKSVREKVGVSQSRFSRGQTVTDVPKAAQLPSTPCSSTAHKQASESIAMRTTFFNPTAVVCARPRAPRRRLSGLLLVASSSSSTPVFARRSECAFLFRWKRTNIQKRGRSVEIHILLHSCFARASYSAALRHTNDP